MLWSQAASELTEAFETCEPGDSVPAKGSIEPPPYANTMEILFARAVTRFAGLVLFVPEFLGLALQGFMLSPPPQAPLRVAHVAGDSAWEMVGYDVSNYIGMRLTD